MLFASLTVVYVYDFDFFLQRWIIRMLYVILVSFFAKKFRLFSKVYIHICNVELAAVFEYSKLLMEDITLF